MSDKFSGHCVHCKRSVGDAAKVQPTFTDGDVWCPRDFIWHRCRMESTPLGVDPRSTSEQRFNAQQMAAARCQFCGWETVCFGAQPGRGLRCGHCGKNGAILLPVDDGSMLAMHESIRSALDVAQKAVA